MIPANEELKHVGMVTHRSQVDGIVAELVTAQNVRPQVDEAFERREGPRAGG